jgi:hypothetical protein
MALPRVSDEASKVALGIIAWVEVPQIWSQWQPSVSTLRGGDWAGMKQSVTIGSGVAWAYSLAMAGAVSWIIGETWPLWGAIVLCATSQALYTYFVTHPAPDNPRAEMPEALTRALRWGASR